MTTGRINQVPTRRPLRGAPDAGARAGGTAPSHWGRGCPKVARGRGDEAPGRGRPSRRTARDSGHPIAPTEFPRNSPPQAQAHPGVGGRGLRHVFLGGGVPAAVTSRNDGYHRRPPLGNLTTNDGQRPAIHRPQRCRGGKTPRTSPAPIGSGAHRCYYQHLGGPNFRATEPTTNPRSSVTRGRYGGRSGMEDGQAGRGSPGWFFLSSRLPPSYIYPPNPFPLQICRFRVTRRFFFLGDIFCMGNVKVGPLTTKKLPSFSARCGLRWDLVVFDLAWDAAIPLPAGRSLQHPPPIWVVVFLPLLLLVFSPCFFPCPLSPFAFPFLLLPASPPTLPGEGGRSEKIYMQCMYRYRYRYIYISSNYISGPSPGKP
jgi:hypothetical protein